MVRRRANLLVTTGLPLYVAELIATSLLEAVQVHYAEGMGPEDRLPTTWVEPGNDAEKFTNDEADSFLRTLVAQGRHGLVVVETKEE